MFRSSSGNPVPAAGPGGVLTRVDVHAAQLDVARVPLGSSATRAQLACDEAVAKQGAERRGGLPSATPIGPNRT